MGFLDKLKDTANMAKEKAAGAVDQHGPQIKEGIGKAGGYLDKKTKGKYSDKIATGTSKAAEALDKTDKSGGPTRPTTPSSVPPLHEPPLHESPLDESPLDDPSRAEGRFPNDPLPGTHHAPPPVEPGHTI